MIKNIPKEFKRYIDNLKVINGLLCYKHHARDLVVALCSLQQDYIICHNHFTSGHFGIFKTHRKILEGFWWPGLHDDVKTFVQSCEICSKVKPLGMKRGKVAVRDWPYKPLNLLSIDYLTELPVSSKGNRHILVINDQFSKYIQIYPVKDRTAKTVSECIVEYFLRFGIPKKLYSDRDPSYEADLFQFVMKRIGVEKSKTTGYNPQANWLAR